MSDETMDFGYRTHETVQHPGVKSSAYVLQVGPVPRTAKVSFPDRAHRRTTQDQEYGTLSRGTWRREEG